MNDTEKVWEIEDIIHEDITDAEKISKVLAVVNEDIIKKLTHMINDQSGWATEAHYVGASSAYRRAIGVIRGEKK
jgi:hypothetical protein